jgi:hypothetical protein
LATHLQEVPYFQEVGHLLEVPHELATTKNSADGANSQVMISQAHQRKRGLLF